MRDRETYCSDYSDDSFSDMFEKIYYDNDDDRYYMNNRSDSEELNFHQNLVW